MPGQRRRKAPCRRVQHYSAFTTCWKTRLKPVIIIFIREQRRQLHWLRPLRPRGLEKNQTPFLLNKTCYSILHFIRTFILINTLFGTCNLNYPSHSGPHYDSASSCWEIFTHLHNHSYFIIFFMYVYVRKTLLLLEKVTTSKVTETD